MKLDVKRLGAVLAMGVLLSWSALMDTAEAKGHKGYKHSSYSSKWHRNSHDNGRHLGWYKQSNKSKWSRRSRNSSTNQRRDTRYNMRDDRRYDSRYDRDARYDRNRDDRDARRDHYINTVRDILR